MKTCEYLNNTSEIYTLNYAIALAGQLIPIIVWGIDNQDKFNISLQSFIIVARPGNIFIDTYRRAKMKSAKYAFFDISAEIGKLTIGIMTAKNLNIINLAHFYIDLRR
jgi:hypothetical protein